MLGPSAMRAWHASALRLVSTTHKIAGFQLYSTSINISSPIHIRSCASVAVLGLQQGSVTVIARLGTLSSSVVIRVTDPLVLVSPVEPIVISFGSSVVCE